jgi:hypothetical protein
MVQEAVRMVLEPLCEPTFHPSSHGFRPNRSCHTAIAEAKSHLEDGYEWVVDLDLTVIDERGRAPRETGRRAAESAVSAGRARGGCDPLGCGRPPVMPPSS